MGNKRAYNEKIRDKKGVQGKMCREISKMEKCMTRENSQRENARQRKHLYPNGERETENA